MLFKVFSHHNDNAGGMSYRVRRLLPAAPLFLAVLGLFAPCPAAEPSVDRRDSGRPWVSHLVSLWSQARYPELGQVVRLVSSAIRLKPLGRFPALSDAETWKRLPPATHGGGQRLPLWARMLVTALPRTTAAMLTLDYEHRARSPLDPRLAGELRWVAAHAMGCRYGEAYAAADLRRAGIHHPELLAQTDFLNQRPAAERAALRFARKLTLASETLTDAEVAFLIKQYGEKRLVAMVQLIAYANFLDRMVLALGLRVEPGGPRPPVDVSFLRQSWDGKASPPQRIAPPTRPVTTGLALIPDADWQVTPIAQLRQAIHQQESCKPRIKLPATDGITVYWGLVGRTYQPELHAAWAACSSVFQREADQDPAVQAHLLWIITRTVHCYY